MRIFVVSIIGFLLAALAAAEESTPYAAEVTASELNLRGGPGEAHQPVLRLARGAKVVVLGQHANDPSWVQVEVPQGYGAWVSAKFLTRSDDGTATISGDRVQIRPRPSTRYAPLNGLFMKGDKTRVLKEETREDGVWCLVQIPRTVPLYAHGDFLKNIGAPSLAEEGAAAAAPEAAEGGTLPGDEKVKAIEPQVQKLIAEKKPREEIERVRMALMEIDRNDLSDEMREHRSRLVYQLMDAEKQSVISELKAKEKQMRGDLDQKLQEIDRSYRRRLQEIREEFAREKEPRYIAMGVVTYKPDLFGRTPAYRLEEAGQMKYFLIAPAYDLRKFVGKRVGVTGLLDPESGTGDYTVMVKRIEIVGSE